MVVEQKLPVVGKRYEEKNGKLTPEAISEVLKDFAMLKQQGFFQNTDDECGNNSDDDDDVEMESD